MPLAAFALAGLASQALARSPRLLRGMIDEPNSRSLHAGVIPRSGGLAIIAGLAGAGLLALSLLPLTGVWAWILAALVPVAAISLLDDLGGVRPSSRLAAHLVSAALLIAGGLGWSHLDLPGLTLNLGSLLTLFLTLLLVVWMINLYNFMDGMDGLAGGMAVFGFGALAILGWHGGDLAYALICASIAAAAGGFLTANFPPARLFLGDLGSTSLGLLAAALSLLGSTLGIFPLWVAGLAFSPFILDATSTLLRRALMGERLWEPHRSHHYQRLVLAGWSHRRVMLRAWALMAACGASAVAAPGMMPGDQWLLLGGWACIYALIGYRVRLVERQSGLTVP